MTAIIIALVDVEPGRNADWLEGTNRFREHSRRLGARKPFVISRSLFSGESSGQYITRSEFDNMTALGAYTAARDTDPAVQDFLASGGFPAKIASYMIYNILYQTGDNNNEQPGTVYWRRGWQVKPSRIGDLLALSEGAASHALQHGARGFRAMQAIIAGPETGTYSTFTRFDDLAAFGRYFDLAQHDPELQQLIARASGPDAPANLLGQSLGVVVQI